MCCEDGLQSFDVLRGRDLRCFSMQRKRKGRMQVGEYMCAIIEIPAPDRSNKIPKESSSSVFSE